MAAEKRMQKGKLIKQYIGEGLLPLGFTYEGRKGDSWVFERKVERVRQEISFYEYRFDKNMLSFDLYTSAGNGVVQATDIQGIEFNSDMPGFWKYGDKEEFIALLIKIKGILMTEGIAILERLSVVREIYPTNEMHHTLYHEHGNYAEKFIKENDIRDTEFTQENIDAWFDIIKRKTAAIRSRSINILDLLYGGYEDNNDIDWLKEEYELFLD